MPNPPQASGSDLQVATARGLIVDALGRSAGLPDMYAIDLSDAFDQLDDPGALPDVVVAVEPDDVSPVELLLRARILLRQAIPEVTPTYRALQLGRAIRHIDSALGRLNGWSGGARS